MSGGWWPCSVLYCTELQGPCVASTARQGRDVLKGAFLVALLQGLHWLRSVRSPAFDRGKLVRGQLTSRLVVACRRKHEDDVYSMGFMVHSAQTSTLEVPLMDVTVRSRGRG